MALSARQIWRDWTARAVECYRRATRSPRGTKPRPPEEAATPTLARLERLRITDGVSRTLFDEYASHRGTDRGDEETGWALLGIREGAEAIALATLPAGAERSAGHAHVRFNSSAQALGSRIIRQSDKRLTLLGVVHTHPGSLRHPSDGDFRGDSEWVGKLRGGEGVFGIGTADAKPGPTPGVGWQPQPNQQSLEKICFSWYALGEGDRAYRPLPVGVVLGPDQAAALRPVWDQVERHADRLDRLARQQTQIRFSVVPGKASSALAVTVPLADRNEAVQLLLEGEEVRYYLIRGQEILAVDQVEDRVDRGLYLLMAELAARDQKG